MGPPAKSGPGAALRRRAASISKNTYFSCERRAERSRGFENILTLLERRRRWKGKSRNDQAARFLYGLCFAGFAASAASTKRYVDQPPKADPLRQRPKPGPFLRAGV